jgi:HPt (histidine-containing phosphotransfer) domain-containing protein
MDRAIEDGDSPALRMAAHTLKSNSADFGAMTLSNLAKELEYMGREESLDGAADLMPQVREAFEKSEVILRDIMGHDNQ